MKSVTLKSILSKKVIVLKAQESVAHALTVMENEAISSIVITDEQRFPVGIFTEYDALRVVVEEIDTASMLSQVMTPNPFCVEETMQMHDAYALMEKKEYRHLIVIDEDGYFVGIVSEGDFLRHIGLGHLTKSKIVSDAMSDAPLVVAPQTSLIDAASRMSDRHCDYAIVLQGGYPVGIITERDIAHRCARDNNLCDERVEGLLRGDVQIISKEISLQDAATMMEKHDTHQLIVVDREGTLVGLLTRHDLLHAIHGSYYEHLIRVIDQKSATIARMNTLKKELRNEKEAIQRSELKLRTLFEALPDGVALVDAMSKKAVEFNYKAYAQLGYTAEEFIQLRISDYETIETPEETHRRSEKIRSKGRDDFETIHRAKDGTLLNMWINVVAIELENHPYLIAVYRNITAQKESEAHLREHQQVLAKQTNFLRALLDNIPDLIFSKNEDGVYLGCNSMFERFFGAKESEIIGKTDFDFVDATLAQFFRDNDKSAMRLGKPRNNEEFLNFADGSHQGMFEVTKVPMVDESGALYGLIGIARDITERKLYEERLETLANYDPLTGLANRPFLFSSLQNSISQAKRHKTSLALLMFDLDRFKDVNDSYGHGVGDELLQMVSERFSERLREGDLISRLGGDEFAIVLEQLIHPEDAGRVASEMLLALGEEYKLSSGASVHIGASVGIVLYPDHGEDASILLQHADAALYKSKSEGRGIYRYFTDELTGMARKRIECETRLRRAVVNNEFEVYYQPQVHISTGRIVGAEALVRWNDPERGIISPIEFIPIAEETGLIGEIGEWVLNETCRQGKIWLDGGHRLTLAVNLSAHQVRHQNIPKMVDKALKASGYSADRLELELTESALMQREEETVAMLHTLRAKGIRLAIDDFGTGYSSLSYLKRFPIDVLKIDKSFVDDLPFDTDDMAIVTAIIAMGKALGFQVLAEGTERIEQIEFLKEKGCTMYQGYYKSPPVPASKFEMLLTP